MTVRKCRDASFPILPIAFVIGRPGETVRAIGLLIRQMGCAFVSLPSTIRPTNFSIQPIASAIGRTGYALVPIPMTVGPTVFVIRAIACAVVRNGDAIPPTALGVR